MNLKSFLFTPLPGSHRREPVEEWSPHAKRRAGCHGRKAVVTGFTIAALFVGVMAWLGPLAAESAILRTLKQGSRGPDVRELQQILNRDPETRVSESGPGSLGNETEYFGPLTHDAVLRLQRKYALDILAPIGLSAPTGIVGTQTRLFLLRLTADKTPPAATSQAATSVNVRPKIISISPAVITKSTAEVTISGENFTATGNTVLVSSELPDAFVNLSSGDGKTLRFTFRFAAAQTLKEQVREAASASGQSYETIAAVVAANVQPGIDGPKTPRIPVIVAVRNSNGQSDPVELMTDLAAILNDAGN